MKPVVRSCPEGVRKVYEAENEWHRLVDTAKYQCNNALPGNVMVDPGFPVERGERAPTSDEGAFR